MTKVRTSEWVSVGHPDKMADFISSYILDRYLEKDWATRYALEVQIKDNFVSLAGEISSAASISDKEMADYTREAVEMIGYNDKYCEDWGETEVPCASKLDVVCHVSKQSPNIAAGVNNDGWGDQGIFWGMAVDNPETDYMPIDYWTAKRIGLRLYASRLGGIDIKTQVTMVNEDIEEVVVAIPTKGSTDDVMDYLRDEFGKEPNIIVNGTGEYVRHGSMGDCGTTGRKLAVDFYGGNCRIGGGSPWTKDGTKADLSLNLLAREISVLYCKVHQIGEVHTSISCKIGRPDICVQIFNWRMEPLIEPVWIKFPPSEAIDLFRLREPQYAIRCVEGLFCSMPRYVFNKDFVKVLNLE